MEHGEDSRLPTEQKVSWDSEVHQELLACNFRVPAMLDFQKSPAISFWLSVISRN